METNTQKSLVRKELISDKHSIFLIVGLSLLVYFTTFNFQFVMDDAAVLKENSYVTAGFDGLKDLFTKGGWDGHSLVDNVLLYRPISQSVFAIIHEFAGLDPVPYHVVHVGFYLILGMVVFFLLKRLFQDKYPYLPLVATLIYMLHPVHTEVVSNVKSEDELLGMLFGSLSWLFVLRYVDEKKIKDWALAALFYLIAIHSKETPVTFLAIIPLSLFFFRKDVAWQEIVKIMIPFIAAVVFFFYIRSQIFEGRIAREPNYIRNAYFLAQSGSEKAAMLLYALGYNLKLTLFPHPLVSSYFYNHVPLMQLGNPKVVFSFLAYAFLAYYSLTRLLKRHILSFAILFFGTTLSPFTNIFWKIGDFLGERWLFSPTLGFAIAAGYLITKAFKYAKEDIFNEAKEDNLTEFLNRNTIPVAILGVLLIAYSIKITERNPAWETSLILMKTDVKTSPDNYLINSILATEMLNSAGNDANKVKESLPYFEKSVKLTPKAPRLWHNYGMALFRLNDHKNALKCYEQAVSLEPTNEQQRFWLGMARYKTGDAKGALEILEPLGKTPRYAQNAGYHNEMGSIYFQMKNYAQAANSYEIAYQGLKPQGVTRQLVDIVHNLGATYLYMNDFAKSEAYFQQNATNIPQDFRGFNGLGINKMNQKQYPQAIEYFQKVLQMNPNMVGAYQNIGICYQQTKQFQQAAEQYEKGLKLAPNNMIFYNNMYNCYLALGNNAKMQETLQRRQVILDQQQNKGK
jgi:tetratricopeptide (TPR) repeat protein